MRKLWSAIILVAALFVLPILSGCGGSGTQIAEKDQRITKLEGQARESSLQIAEKDQQIAKLEAQIGAGNSQVAEKDQQIAGLKTQIVEKDGKIAGLQAELAKASRNPTAAEVTLFLANDLTDRAFASFQYSHLEAVHQVVKNAGSKGLKAFTVTAMVASNTALYFAGFKTSDKGVVYILTSIDREVKLVEGEDYYKANGFSGGPATILKIFAFE